MDTEDITAAKLKGYNIMVKFIDGETVFLRVTAVEDLPISEAFDEFFERMNNFLYKKESYFPAYCMSVNRDTIKYVKKI